ncbi:NAD(P)H-binding protein [Planotetraspora phitsanulokensis]|uniref:NAD-dependent dehydratase n=1 Tax=Planotetraspora phitsanulokensis TaxID=575192 RepID=A0A8J3XE14_9ACTN|nr:SDR family oxidoreductase [Planotetraspora phitsanulokensis]GII37610.1 NAD-dependent dehydratase [Planotetraspora phitsanulokensis]
MRVVIAGGHGKIALRLERLLAERDDAPVGLIRDPSQAGDLRSAGAEPVVCDLERAGVDEVAEIVLGAGAVVFAAGAGPGSGAARKHTVDRGASVLLADAAEHAGVPRFIQISTMGGGSPRAPGTGESWSAYITAKAAAEEDLRARELSWTILRPGRLTDEPGTGLVTLADPPLPYGEVSRDDVAAVIAALIDRPETRHRTLELIGGGVPIDQAMRLLVFR